MPKEMYTGLYGRAWTNVDDVFTTELCQTRSVCVRHVHVTKISIWRVYAHSNSDSLNIIRRYNH